MIPHKFTRMLQASMEFDLIMILLVWGKQYRYELGGHDETLFSETVRAPYHFQLRLNQLSTIVYFSKLKTFHKL